ncbi:hypothetical protein LN042_22740 [Kitasatospora sp. RB6PN24]|uniref:hypothetical protein n=1 Tax=Kitasatospora humi TaxID=2893891 RepID=UPI001E4A3422|nr:hypothetical protein [Kitasatospora humi]MCC9309853.1 hypothetical protein [Kitasatospora humi]
MPDRDTTDDVGSVRHSLTLLLPVAAGSELVLGLVGGLPALGLGSAVLGAVALLTGRYVIGAASEDSGYRRDARLMTTRVPGIGDWYWILRGGSDPDGYPSSLRPQLQRLYAARLSERHGVSLHTEPVKAAALVGADLWPWIDPAQPPPSTTLPPDRLGALIDRLDAL